MYKDLDINKLEKLKGRGNTFYKESYYQYEGESQIIYSKESFGQSNQDILEEEIQLENNWFSNQRGIQKKRETQIEFMFKIFKKIRKSRKKEMRIKLKRKQEYKLQTALLRFDQEQQELYDKKNYRKDNSVDTLYHPNMNREKN